MQPILATIDPWILAFSALTVIATIWMGFWSARRSKTAGDFFVAGRSVSVGWNASAISGEYLSAASFMGVAGMVMSSGYDALWYPVCYACGYLFLLLFIAGPLRRFGAYTIPDFAEGRFDSPLFRKIAVVFVLFIGFFYTMPQMKGAGTTLAYIFPGLPYWAGVVLVGAVITLNVALGGMKGITLVQAFQYWAKMFAISVPIFVLMAVYGHYGKQLGLNNAAPVRSAPLFQVFNESEVRYLKSIPFVGLTNAPLLQRTTRYVEAQYHKFKGAGFALDASNTNISLLGVINLYRSIDTMMDGVMFPLEFVEARPSFPPSLQSGSTDTNLSTLHQRLEDILGFNGIVGIRSHGFMKLVRREWIEPQDKTVESSTLVRKPLPEKATADSNHDLTNLPTSIQSETLSLGGGEGTVSMVVGREIAVGPVKTTAWVTRSNVAGKVQVGSLAIPLPAPVAEAFFRNGLANVSQPAFADVVRKPLPEKAPADSTWLSPFGPLTTKAAKAANAVTRWNLSPELRANLRDLAGRPPVGGLEAIAESTEKLVEELTGTKAAPPSSQFLDWTDMPTNTSRGLAGGFPMLATLREYGLLRERPVLVATNLPRPKVTIGGSFQSRDAFLEHLESRLLTNGVRLSVESDVIKAVAVLDWELFQRAPEKIVFVPNRFSGMRITADIKALAYQYGRISDAKNDPDNINVLFPTNFPVMAVDFNPDYELLLVHEARPRMEKYLAERGVTLIPASSKEVWAVPTSDIARYQAPAVNVRGYSLLYTYSLIIALVCGTAGLPHILVRFYTNPDGVAAKRTTMWVMILIGIFYVFPPVFGVMGRNLFPELYAGVGAKGTDKIVLELPRLLNAQYAPLGSILSGITCAGAFAAFMSTFSGLLVSMTGAVAHDVYGRMLRPKSTPQQRLRAFKIAAVGIGAVAILLGMQVEPLQINFMVGQAFAIAAASYFPLLFMCAWWRGMTMKGAATGMLAGGLLALAGISLTSFTDLKWLNLADFWATHPLLRILCEQPAIWTVPLAIGLMIVVSKLTKKEIPSDIRMKMLVLHAPEKLGLKQEYIQEHQPGH